MKPERNWRSTVPHIDRAARQPMSAAPRDGTVVLLERRRHAIGKQPKDVIIAARWSPNPPGIGHLGRWVLLVEWSSAGGQDDKYLGWWPLPAPADEAA